MIPTLKTALFIASLAPATVTPAPDPEPAKVIDPQEVLEQEPIQQEIVVVAAREEQPRDQASAAVTVLDRETLDRLPGSSLAEVLAFVPGVTVLFDSGTGGPPMLTSRGFFGGGEVEYVKLMVDGVPVGDAESGLVDWQRFRASEIERIEILHGPGSALYGDTALGGVVQVFTSSGRDGPSGDLHLELGSFGARELDASYGTALGAGFRLQGTAGAWATDGFRDHAEAEGHDARVTLEHLGDRSRWRVDAETNRQQREQPGALTRDDIDADRTQSSDLFRFDGRTTSRSRLRATFDGFGRAPIRTTTRATLYGLQRDDDDLRSLLLAPGFGTSAFRELATDVFGGTFEVSRELSGNGARDGVRDGVQDGARGVVRAGTDFERADLSAGYAFVDADGRPGAPVTEEDGRRDRLGLFATGAWSFAERWSLSAGLRYDEIRDDLMSAATGGDRRTDSSSDWSPRVGLNVRLGPAESPVSLFVQASSAFKAPTLEQLFDSRPYPDGFGGTFTISNPELRPQRARNFEVGLSRSAADHDWSVVAYRMNVRNEIDFDARTFTYRNLGESRHRGVETSVALAKRARVSPRLTYAWTSVADRETPDVQLKNIPEHSAQLFLHWRVTENSSADLAYRWRDGLTLDDEGAFLAPSVSRVDLRLAHELSRASGLRLQLDVLNALDERYNELGFVLVDFIGRPTAFEFPAPGRAVRFGVSWTLRSQN